MYNFILTLDNIEDIAEAIWNYIRKNLFIFLWRNGRRKNHTDQGFV